MIDYSKLLPKPQHLVVTTGDNHYATKNLNTVTVSDVYTLHDYIESRMVQAHALTGDNRDTLTRFEYAQFPKEKRNKMKLNTPFITAGVSEGGRTRSDFSTANLLLLDVDRNNLSLMNIITKWMTEYDFVVWPTLSWQPSDMRWAMALPLREPVNADEYRAGYLGFIESLHATLRDACDTEQGYIEKPRSTPVEFSDSSLTVYAQMGTVGTLDLKQFIKPEDMVAITYAKQFGDDTALENARPTTKGLTVEHIKTTLQEFDHNYEPDWIDVGRALHHQFDGKLEGLDIWCDWASQSAKFNRNEHKRKWEKMSVIPDGSIPLTWASLERKVVEKHSRSETRKAIDLVTKALDADQLTDACDKISAMHDIKGSDFTEVKAKIKARAKEIGEKWPMEVVDAKVKAKNLRAHKPPKSHTPAPPSQVNATQYQPPIGPAGPLDPTTGEDLKWWQRYVVTSNGNPRVFDLVERRSLEVASFNATNNRYLVDPRSTKLAMNAFKFLTEQLGARTVFDSQYRPDKPEVFKEDDLTWANEYNPHSLPMRFDPLEETLNPQPLTQQERMDVSLFLRHVCAIAGEDARNLIRWMAWAVQNQGKPASWVPLINGVHGCGKTMMGDVMMAVMGRRNSAAIKGDELHGDFNWFMGNRSFIVVEELKDFGGHRSGTSTANKLKTIVTNDTVSVNEKFKSQRLVKNTSVFIAFTNYFDPITVDGATERRWFMVRSPLQAGEDVSRMAAKRGHQYFADVKALAEERSAYAIRKWLFQYDLGNWSANGTTAPKTRWWDDCVALSRPINQLAIEDLLNDDWIGNHKDEGWFSMPHLQDYARHLDRDALAAVRSRSGREYITKAGYRLLELSSGKDKRIKIDGRNLTIYVHESRLHLWEDRQRNPDVIANLNRQRIKKYFETVKHDDFK